MAYSITLKNLKKVIPLATALATITSFLAPESAQALLPRIKYSGNIAGDSGWVDFIIDPSVSDADPNPNAGLFPGAIKAVPTVI
ncbi:MAG TPA: hypothetical protein V6D12_24005 [Candidatus Obscuribacterales bacterium]